MRGDRRTDSRQTKRRRWLAMFSELVNQPQRGRSLSPARRAGFEPLEDRALLAASLCVPLEYFDPADYPPKPYADPSTHPLFAPGTSSEYIEQLESNGSEQPVAPFTLASRWTRTATDGSGLTQGDPTTITWSIAPDGTPIPALGGISGESSDPSNLVSYLGGIYGTTTDDNVYTDEPWFPLFQSVFDRWSELSGINYVYEPNDDGAEFTSFSLMAPGVLGTRGDVRIGGHHIDGGSGVLAYNFYPDNGEMVIDTGDSFYNSTGSNSLRLRNVLSHELGHGIGLRHSVSSDANFLMEPFATTAFDGPQLDDILGAQRHYGDANENNDNISTATALGTFDVGQSLTIGTDAVDTAVAATEIDFVSIDSESETDFYAFELTAAATVELLLSPTGPTYQIGPQGGSQSPYDARQQSDLVLEIHDASGAMVSRSDLGGIGDAESISFTASGAGSYYAVVSGKTAGRVQAYELSVAARSAGKLTPFERFAPLGGMIAASESNFGELSTASSSQTYSVFLQAGETIAAIATPDSSAVLSLEVVGLTPAYSSLASGLPVELPAVTIPADGLYDIRLSTDAATVFELSLVRNATVGDLVLDTADGAEARLDASFVSLGSGRYGAVGETQLGGNAPYEFVQTNDSSKFIDISATGASATLGDENQFDISTSIGNEIFAAGTISISSNGGVIGSPGAFLEFTNGSLPSTSFEAALLPFWDDLKAGQIYWQETVVEGVETLIIQWDNWSHFDVGGDITFQLQLFKDGPTLVRFAYQDVRLQSPGDRYSGGGSATIGVQMDANTAVQFSRDTPSLSDHDVVELIKIPPEVDEYEIDLTGLAGQAIDVVLAGQGSVDFSGQSLELLDVDGATVLATAIPDPLSAGTNASNLDLGILGFTIPADGIYSIRLTANLPAARYGLLVTESLSFEIESNDQPGDPLRLLTPSPSAVGYLDATLDSYDDFAIELALNQFVSLTTTTPLDHSSAEPVSTLDPQLEVVGPDGVTLVASDSDSASDGKNALLSFFAPVAGTYTVRIRAASGAGEYTLADGQIEPPPPTDVFINEVVENPGGAVVPDQGNEYVELRGPAGRTLSGVYLAILDGNAGTEMGKIGASASHLIDLSGSSIGGNGFLVIVDDAIDPYAIAPGTAVIDVPGFDLPGSSYTAMLLHVAAAGTPPSNGDDLDAGDDGLDNLPSGWSMVDALSVLDGGVSDRAYAPLAFSPDGSGLIEPAGVVVDAGPAFEAGSFHHVMRIGNSTGSSVTDWVAQRHQESPIAVPPAFVRQSSTDSAYLSGFVTTYHLGQANPAGTDSLSVSIADSQVSETAGAAATTVTITRSSGTALPLLVNLFSDRPSEATVPVTATIPAGQVSVTVAVDAVDELIVDGNQTVTITASAIAHQDGAATLEITDNDTAAVTVEDVSGTEGGTLLFTVTLDKQVSVPFEVDVSFVDGTASGGIDFNNSVQTLAFAGGAGETQQFSVVTNEDLAFEGNETFIVTLAAAHPGVTDADVATGTIVDNDPRPPGVESVVFDDGTGHRSTIRYITVTFDTEVTVQDGAFVVAAADGTEVDVVSELSVLEGKTRAVLTFSGPRVDASGSLIDGNYRLTVVDSKITDGGGLNLDGDGDGIAGTSRVDDFFRLYGDANGDRTVDLIDFSAFRTAFGFSSPNASYQQEFDENGDGNVDLLDFAAFRARFGTVLPP